MNPRITSGSIAPAGISYIQNVIEPDIHKPELAVKVPKWIVPVLKFLRFEVIGDA